MKTRVAKIARDRGRIGIALSALAALLGGLLLVAGSLLIFHIWTLETNERTNEIHFFHAASEAVAFGLFPGLSLLVLAISSGSIRSVAQFLVVFAVLLAIAGLLFDAVVLIPAAIIGGLVFALYPNRRDLFNVLSGTIFSWPGSIVAAATVTPLLIDAYRNLDLQFRRAGGEHHEFQHWAITAIMDISITIVILLAVTRAPGWRVMSIMGGLALLVTGVTSLLVPFHAGSWGVEGGMAAIVAGVFYLTIPAWQHAAAERPRGRTHADALASS